MTPLNHDRVIVTPCGPSITMARRGAPYNSNRHDLNPRSNGLDPASQFLSGLLCLICRLLERASCVGVSLIVQLPGLSAPLCLDYDYASRPHTHVVHITPSLTHESIDEDPPGTTHSPQLLCRPNLANCTHHLIATAGDDENQKQVEPDSRDHACRDHCALESTVELKGELEYGHNEYHRHRDQEEPGSSGEVCKLHPRLGAGELPGSRRCRQRSPAKSSSDLAGPISRTRCQPRLNGQLSHG